MWRKKLLLTFTILFHAFCNAQNLSEMESIMNFLGVVSPEDIDPDEAERLSDYITKPIRLNVLTLEELESSGILNTFQAVSLVDYRKRHGDVMSFNELAALDGFNKEIVEQIQPFVSLQGGNFAPSQNRRPEVDISIRGGYKLSPVSTEADGNINHGLKFRLNKEGHYSISFSASKSYDALGMAPDSYSGNVTYSFRNIPMRFIVGDFNARFGQGLTLWNGMAMSGFDSPSAFIRNQTGIKPTWSFTGSSAMTGVAVETSIRRVRFSGMIALPECRNGLRSVMPAINASWYGKNMRCGVTHYSEINLTGLISDMKTSADISICKYGADVFSEVSYDWVNGALSSLAGVRITAGDLLLASMLRYYHPEYKSSWSGAARSLTKCSNEYGTSLAVQFSKGRTGDKRKHIAVFSIDAAYLPVPKQENARSIQVRSSLNWKYMITRSLQIDFRCTERYRTWGMPLRSDIRMDIRYNSTRYLLSARINFLKYRKQSYLTYLEGGYLHSKELSIYLKHGIFIVDNWDDRIYAYERDAPGNFNVPAFYGRGLWVSATASWKFTRWGKLYARCSMTSYPFMKEEKPGKAELKLQCVFSL